MAYKKKHSFILCIICIVASVLSLLSQFDHNLHVPVAITFSLSCHTVIFYLPKNITLKKVENFSSGYKHISYKNLQVTDATVTSSLLVCVSAILLLLTVRT